MAIERTLSIIKPYAVAKNVIGQIYARFEKAGLKIESAGLEWVAKSTTELPEAKTDTVLEFLSKLQDHEDVENVYTNLG